MKSEKVPYEATLTRLRARGHRLTPQRTMILDALHHFEGHLTADQILSYVQQQYPYMDLSTIYRTLDLLTELNVVQVFVVNGGPNEYELVEEPHHHLVCRQCHLVTELAADHFQPLAQHLLQEHGFQADFDHLAITGLCDQCRTQAQPPLA